MSTAPRQFAPCHGGPKWLAQNTTREQSITTRRTPSRSTEECSRQTARAAGLPLLPFVGNILQSIWKVFSLWLWIVLGSYFGQAIWGRRGMARTAVALYSLCIVTLAFLSTYAVGYYAA